MELAAVALVAVVVVVAAGFHRSRIEKVERRVRRLEAQVQDLCGHVGLEPGPGGPSPEVLQLIVDGKRIAAIKAHMDDTGLDLKAAKQALDRY